MPSTCSTVPYYVISGLPRSLTAFGILDRPQYAAHVQNILIPNMAKFAQRAKSVKLDLCTR